MKNKKHLIILLIILAAAACACTAGLLLWRSQSLPAAEEGAELPVISTKSTSEESGSKDHGAKTGVTITPAVTEKLTPVPAEKPTPAVTGEPSPAPDEDPEKAGVKTGSRDTEGTGSTSPDDSGEDTKDPPQDGPGHGEGVPPEEPETPAVYDDLEEVPAGTVLSAEQVDWDNISQYFRAYELSPAIRDRITGPDRSYKPGAVIPYEHLRYIKVLHYNFNHQIQVGELMVNYLLADEMVGIFFRLFFDHQYEIYQMRLVDDFAADDNTSIANNNTSAFNYRNVTFGSTLSSHAFGCAIDINPIQNPYVWYDANGNLTGEDPEWYNYVERGDRDHMITYNDPCYLLFAERGYVWGGNWSDPIDYQHFEKQVYP